MNGLRRSSDTGRFDSRTESTKGSPVVSRTMTSVTNNLLSKSPFFYLEVNE